VTKKKKKKEEEEEEATLFIRGSGTMASLVMLGEGGGSR
jgi:hypothetical protein